MKKYILVLIILLSFILIPTIQADCKDEDLNEWATKVEPLFKIDEEVEIPFSGKETEEEYAYFISITPYREDVIIKVSDGEDTIEGQKFGDFYGTGWGTTVNETTYTIKIYGGEDSKCKNELLKTLTYKVPVYNELMGESICDEYPDNELCQPFTNKTKDMTQEEFVKEVKKTEPSSREDRTASEIIIDLLKYSLYVIIPFGIITIVFFIKKREYKKKEENR